MSRVQVFKAYDDIRHSQGKEELADCVVRLMYGENIVELDLTPITMIEALDMPLGELLKMGRPVINYPRQRGPDKQARRSGEELKAYMLGLRTYVREHDLEDKGASAKLSDYPKSVRRRYDQSLAAQVRGSVP